VGAHDGLQETLADVRRALDTVDDGTWGFCDVCGQPTAAERLEAPAVDVVPEGPRRPLSRDTPTAGLPV